MLLRKELEKQEYKLLAPYAMKSAESLGRRYKEKEHQYRTVFQRDRDRIIHSTAFRRLEYKTQVFVNHEGDHYRTRLTHTIEVTQIARTIGRALRLNEDLIEAIALAHDLGHTPFGHAGEAALSELMKDYGGFEHNAQGLRMVELLERRYPQFTGLNLSYEVRESLVKHSTTYDSALTPDEYHPEWQPLLEAQVVAMADMIAYDNHDLDDGIRSGLIREEVLRECSLWRRVSAGHRRKLTPAEQEMFLRPQTVISLINIEVSNIVERTLKSIRKYNIKSVTDVRKCNERLVRFSDRIEQETKELKRLLYENLYRHYRVERMTQKAKRFIEDLFNAYLTDPKQLPPRYQKMAIRRSEALEWRRMAKEDGDSDIALRRAICDYIAGMTDRYVQEEYKKLFYPFERI
ncbi:MAG: deoxyguanosinetriphosphate triphosphohydrolase [Planctomycetota bacterium]|nr:deoxyguanosinetriphosphate triphosphohydrolase [Planctomycetota bacterium]